MVRHLWNAMIRWPQRWLQEVCSTRIEARHKVYALVIADAAAILLAGIFAVFLRFEFSLPMRYVQHYFMLAILEVPLRIVIYSFWGLYNRLWRYASQ